MTELKLAQMPDRTPVKLGICVLPELHQALVAYAALYAQTYGREELVTELIPAMLGAFLESDRAFVKWQQAARISDGRRASVTGNVLKG